MSIREAIPDSYIDGFFEYLERRNVAVPFVAFLIIAPVLFSVTFSGYYIEIPEWVSNDLPESWVNFISLSLGLLLKIFNVLLTAFALFSLIGFSWVRFKSIGISKWEDSMEEIEASMRNTVAESLGPYGRVSRTRGRDVFGPIVGPAENVTITLSLHEVCGYNGTDKGNKHGKNINMKEGEIYEEMRSNKYMYFFRYSLTYEIEFDEALKSSLLVETLIAPIYICKGGENGIHNCHRYNIPESYQMTVDFNPVIVTSKSINDKIVDIPLDVTYGLNQFEISQADTIDINRDQNRKLMIGRMNEEVEVPIKTALIPKGSNMITAKIENMKHPVESQPFKVSSPIQTKELDVICRTRCPLTATRFESVEEFPRVKKTSVDDSKILQREGGPWDASGRRWTKRMKMMTG